MTRIDSTINLGFAGHVKYQAAGRGPGEKLESRGSNFSRSSISCRTSRKLSRRSWRSSTVRSILALYFSAGGGC